MRVFIIHLKICPLAAEKGQMPFRSTGRSTGQRSNFWPLSPAVDRPVDRAKAYGRPPGRPPHPRVGWLQSVDRTVNRPSQLGLCARLVHIGRPTTGPVHRPGRPPEPGRYFSGFKNWSFKLQLNPIKSHKFHKNQFLYYLWNTNMCDKNSTHISNYLNHFCDLKNLP